ncbi:MAG: hypothetical protein ABL883_12505 [Terricaulis sp.]
MRTALAAFAASCLLAGCSHPGKLEGRLCDPSAPITEELAAIDVGERIAATVEENAWTAEQRRSVEVAGALLESRQRPVSEQDVAILDRATTILSSEANWDRADDRQCRADDGKFSLFCALQQASVETLGGYQHRRVALQEVRFALEEATIGRAYEHRLRDFNNDPATTLADVHAVIAVARGRIAARLAAHQMTCR